MANAQDKRKRRFARAAERLPIKLSYNDGDRSFEAMVYSADVSVGGVFLSTEFFLNVGMELDLEFHVPNDDRVVRVSGTIVREVRLDNASRSKTVSGFAIRFTDYHDDAKTVLASAFLIVELDDFVQDYLRRRTKRPSSELEQLTEVIVAWEVGKMDLADQELDLLRDRIRTDSEGHLVRRGSSAGGAMTHTHIAARVPAPAPSRRSQPSRPSSFGSRSTTSRSSSGTSRSTTSSSRSSASPRSSSPSRSASRSKAKARSSASSRSTSKSKKKATVGSSSRKKTSKKKSRRK